MSSSATKLLSAPNYTVAIRKVDPAEGDRIRAQDVRYLLQRILTELRPKLDPTAWKNDCWAELQYFTEALASGGMHPALIEWQTTKDRAGNPALSSRELYTRRLAVLLVIALRRIGLSARKARRVAAAELGRAGVFDNALTAKVIEHWQERDFPALDPGAELLLATGIATAGRDPRRIALYFIGLCHFAHNPTAVVVRDSSDLEAPHNPPGYMGHF